MTALLVGYARVSTDEQDLTAQRDALASLGVAPERVYVDHGLTGTNRERPGLREALAACPRLVRRSCTGSCGSTATRSRPRVSCTGGLVRRACAGRVRPARFAEVHIVNTAPELSRQIPAAWQEDVKNRSPYGSTTTSPRSRNPPWTSIDSGGCAGRCRTPSRGWPGGLGHSHQSRSTSRPCRPAPIRRMSCGAGSPRSSGSKPTWSIPAGRFRTPRSV
jgi:hypothetical protein